jgi:hypothetical protein
LTFIRRQQHQPRGDLHRDLIGLTDQPLERLAEQLPVDGGHTSYW